MNESSHAPRGYDRWPNYTGPTADELDARNWRILRNLGKSYDKTDLDPDVDDGHDYDHQGADDLEAKYTEHREWRAGA